MKNTVLKLQIKLSLEYTNQNIDVLRERLSEEMKNGEKNLMLDNDIDAADLENNSLFD